MRASDLMRSKWDEKRGSQTYGERTIASAMSGIVGQKRLIMNNAQQVKPEPISWLWKNKIPIGKSLRARLGISSDAGSRPKSDILAIYQVRLEWLSTTLGESLLKQLHEAGPLTEFESFLDFLQRGEGKDRHDFDRWSIDAVMDEAITAMVDTARILGKETLQRFSAVMDARLANDPGRMGRPSVRRAYARAVYRHDRDAISAVKRIAYEPGGEQTPASEFSEAALTAQTLAFVGTADAARSVLSKIHEEGVGCSRPAKKDPQYLLWEDFLVRANK